MEQSKKKKLKANVKVKRKGEQKESEERIALGKIREKEKEDEKRVVLVDEKNENTGVTNTPFSKTEVNTREAVLPPVKKREGTGIGWICSLFIFPFSSVSLKRVFIFFCHF
ncbi:hypothetical protein FACS189472_08940 [Alphaproteobacteria bacterium]|nr:hypothetical protein FACS189472_08940 [Alphaproteobacteria bacterium]